MIKDEKTLELATEYGYSNLFAYKTAKELRELIQEQSKITPEITVIAGLLQNHYAVELAQQKRLLDPEL